MNNPYWYRNNYRRNLVDMHIDAWRDEFLSEFDPDTYFRCLQKAQIQGPMIYTHSHVGYTNWPSESGEMHPGFRGERKIKRLFDLCNNAGMDTIAYYSLIYNNWAYDKYPQWRMLDVDGHPSRDVAHLKLGKNLMMEGRGRYGLLCPNNEEYRSFVSAQLKELFQCFTCKGIFLDMTFWPIVCYCDSCRKRFRDETGLELPETIDWKNKAWLAFQRKREEWMTEFAFFATGEVKKIAPEVTVEHQYSTATHCWSYGIVSDQADASDYIGGDLYGGMEQQSLVCKLYYDLTRNQPFEYMTSRCDPSLHDHTTTKSMDALKLHAYLTYAHHGAFLAIDAIDPRGTMNESFYDTLGQVFSETKRFEPYFKGQYRADVALYFSFISKLDGHNPPPRRAYADGKPESEYLNCVLGAAKALRRSHTMYRIINDHHLKTLGQNREIVLTDTPFLTPREEDALQTYVENGGTLYLSGITSPTLTKRLLGLNIVGTTQEDITYMSPTDIGLKYFEGMYTADYPMTVFGTQVLAENIGNAAVLATVTLPYTDPQDTSKLASIHSNPPGIHTQSPAIVMGAFGKGRVIWAAAPIERDEQPVHKRVFINLLNELSNERLIDTDAPPQVEITVFEDTQTGVLQTHCVNIQEHFPLIPISSFSLWVRTDRPAKTVRKLPDEREIAFTNEYGGVRFAVNSLHIFAMYEIGL